MCYLTVLHLQSSKILAANYNMLPRFDEQFLPNITLDDLSDRHCVAVSKAFDRNHKLQRITEWSSRA